MSRAVFIVLVLVAVVAICTHEASAHRGHPGPQRPVPGRPGPGRPGPGRPGPGRPGRCGPNEIWNNCGTACPRTCRNQNPRGPCPAVCRVGCQCKSGFVRQANGRCVRPSQCPRKG